MILGRLGRMAYINTLPVDWGMLEDRMGRLVSIHRGAPTTLNSMLSRGELDLSPVSSVAASEHADEWLVLDGLCIGCKGAVGSVILDSDRPVEELDGARISVTSASATAAKLLEVLLALHWKIKVELVHQDSEASARMLIGDQALLKAQFRASSFVYDLGQVWRDFTGRDFVFGLWCIRRDFASAHPERAEALYHFLHLSRCLAAANDSEVISEAAEVTGLSRSRISSYYQRLVYTMDDGLWSGLRHFLGLIGHNPDRLEVFGESGMRPQRSGGSIPEIRFPVLVDDQRPPAEGRRI